jgi:hypothetical protein
MMEGKWAVNLAGELKRCDYAPFFLASLAPGLKDGYEISLHDI